LFFYLVIIKSILRVNRGFRRETSIMIDAMKLEEFSCDFKEDVAARIPEANFDLCLTCGTCTGGCPASEQYGMDPRKFLRMLLLGMDDEIRKSPWAWVCTMCGRCMSACPMKINIPKLIYNVRASWDRDKRPKGIRGSCDQHIKSGNAMGVPKEDFVFTIEDVAKEIRENQPEFSDLEVTTDRVGAYMVLNQNSREPVTEPDELGPLWKILHKVKADWTHPTVMWGGENYCMFLADEEGWRYIMEEFVYHIEHNLKSKVVVNTE
jgi:heterodisulfide reductase subunit C